MSSYTKTSCTKTNHTKINLPLSILASDRRMFHAIEWDEAFTVRDHANDVPCPLRRLKQVKQGVRGLVQDVLVCYGVRSRAMVGEGAFGE